MLFYIIIYYIFYKVKVFIVKKIINKKILTEKTLYWFIFLIYLSINLILMLKHEPWRDEIHAWLMAKELSIPELVSASRFDGHPIMWHLILMPFAKLGFPIITLNIISYIIIAYTVWLFLFKTNFSMLFKIIVAFTIPFTYIFSAISRNYCLLLLILMLISVLYNKRYQKPLLYSILIALLVHTHSLAWGIVAGLTITFHFDEIFLFFKKQNHVKINQIFFGLAIIVISTILVVLELYGTSNTDYGVAVNSYITYVIIIMCLILFSALMFTIFNKKNYKEFIILTFSYAFQILIYTCFYSSVLFQRFMLIFALFLYYLILLSKTDLQKKKLDILCIVYLAFICIFAINQFTNTIINDIKYPYSSAEEMANYINDNLPENSTILVDASVIGQSIIPYLNNATLYDIAYESYVDCANVSHNKVKINNALNDLSSYSGYYIIICNDFVKLNYDIIYETNPAIVNEKFTLYYIK